MFKSTNKKSDNDVKGNFNILPDEIVMEVLNFLPSVEKLYLISKQWFNLIKKNRQFYLVITNENIATMMNLIRTGYNFHTSSHLNYQVHLSVLPSNNEDLKLLGSSISIGKMACCYSLSLEQYNWLFPTGIQSLTHLECNGDDMLVDFFVEMVNLKSLVLRDTFPPYLTGKLSKLTNLTSLELSTRKSIYPVDEVEKLTNLQVLKLSSFHLDLDDPTAFYKMKNLSNLTNLEMVCCYDMGTILAETISNYTKLTNLHILNCQVGDEEVKYFKQLTKLTDLDLGYNNLTFVGVQHLASLTNLTSLNLSLNDIGNEALKSILPQNSGLSYLQPLTNLQHLNLSQCKLTVQDITPLSECISLTNLCLNSNKLIGDEGAKFLAKSMKLRRLDVNYCGIKYSGLKTLGKSKKIESTYGIGNDINNVQLLMLLGYKNLILYYKK